jgi:hypothetical protein
VEVKLVTTTPVDKTYDELTRLFNLYRLSELNRRYYGYRAESFERLQNGALLVAAVLSAIALGILLGIDSPKTKFWAAALAGVSAVVTTAVQYLKWDETARRFYFLHQSYGQLFAEIEALTAEVRRSDEITEQQIGSAKTLHDAFGRIEVLDEMYPKRELIDRLTAEVNKAFPDDYIWNNL